MRKQINLAISCVTVVATVVVCISLIEPPPYSSVDPDYIGATYDPEPLMQWIEDELAK